MNFTTTYEPGPTRDEVDALPGLTVLEFGTSWCGICRAAQDIIRQTVEAAAGDRHLKIEDGPGKPLGRSFKVKLWPTIVILKDGREIARTVRPASSDDIAAALRQAA